ncbi:MAG TPA: hypothetical protein VFA74_07060 [Terriglobales bacterium]|nr:hypothetical protein [Terriglobales bacterium]
MKSPVCLFCCLVAISLVIPFVPPALDAASSGYSSDEPGAQASKSEASQGTTIIPGPMRSFLRMAGISQKVSPDEILPLLTRNVFSQGYEGWRESGRPTEFLVLLNRYVHQARELSDLAGPERVIRVAGCEQARPLLRVLGYGLRSDCGQSTTFLVTADAERAFLTTDSGFPLPDLEEALQGFQNGGKPFVYPFPESRVPMLFTENDWVSASKEGGKAGRNLVDVMIRDSSLARLYWAMTHIDAETRDALRQSVGLRKLLPNADILDFYGSHIAIRSGRVLVPGGPDAEPVWKDLVGASPESPGEFVPRLLAKDKGWLAAYFDALSRINQAQQAHFAQAGQLKRYYEAFRGSNPSIEAARQAFRPAPGLLLLLTSVRWEANGEPHVPGSLEVWKEILRQKTDYKIVRDWSRRTRQWNRPEQLLEAMFAFSRMETDSGPLQIYLALNELDAKRAPERQLSPQTVRLLADKFSNFSNQYLIFSEFPELGDTSITEFLNTAEIVGKIPNHTLRGNAMGIFEANVGLWQILSRQKQIPSTELEDSWQKVIKPFSDIHSSAQLFDSGRNSLGEILRASTGKTNYSQDEIINLLAGPDQTSLDGRRIHEEVANRIRSVMDGQRLVSLDTLLQLGDGLNEMAKGGTVGDSLIPLAGELQEFEMPRPIFTGGERTQWAAGIYNNRHTELQMRTDLMKIIKSPASHAQLEEARGKLSSFLRDTLVGLNYAYYEPPGAQILHNNPLFVRSHDFAGDTVVGVEHVWQAPQLFGEGSPAAGGAHLIGSLADLPYVLAEVEQDFISPENVQALIWRELVPGLLMDATLPRWWGVSKNELHAVALYQRSGEEILTAAAGNTDLRGKVINVLSERVAPKRSEEIEQGLHTGQLDKVLPQMLPAETFYLAAEFRRRFPRDVESIGSASRELAGLNQQYAAEISWERLSRDFGVPHPVLTQSYSRELLILKPFPAFSGYSSRLLAESWDSSNLYWARLADEMGYAPVMLNRLVPELTGRMVGKIFATDLEDWPAILRAMRETGEEFRQGKIAVASTAVATSRP